MQNDPKLTDNIKLEWIVQRLPLPKGIKVDQQVNKHKQVDKDLKWAMSQLAWLVSTEECSVTRDKLKSIRGEHHIEERIASVEHNIHLIIRVL